nr:hypothetical protein [uncultured Halomonas sp.]
MSKQLVVNSPNEISLTSDELADKMAPLIAKIVDERLVEAGLIKKTGESQPTTNIWTFNETDTAGLPD